MSTRKKRRIVALVVGVVLSLSAGSWLLAGGPGWLGLPTVIGVCAVAFAAPRFDDGSPPEGPGWTSVGPMGGC